MGSIIYLGHASFLIKAKDFQIVLDPYRDESVPNMTFPEGIETDAVFCSHHHFDHDATNLVKIKKDPMVVKGVRVVVPHDRDGGTKRGMNTIRMFDIDGYKVVHMGDTGLMVKKPLIGANKTSQFSKHFKSSGSGTHPVSPI